MVDRHDKVLVATMRITTNTTPTHIGGTREYWLNHLVVVIAAGKRPASIPNLEAKPASADGTAPGRVWESRTPPQHSIQAGGARNTIVPSPTRLLYAGPPAYTTTLMGEHTPNPNHTLPVSVGSIRVRNGANTHALCSLAYSPFVISYEALDPVLCRVLSDERVLAAPLLQMALESFIRLIR